MAKTTNKYGQKFWLNFLIANFIYYNYISINEKIRIFIVLLASTKCTVPPKFLYNLFIIYFSFSVVPILFLFHDQSQKYNLCLGQF